MDVVFRFGVFGLRVVVVCLVADWFLGFSLVVGL